MLTISVVLPYLNTPIQNLFNEGIEAGRRIPRAAAERVPAALAPARTVPYLQAK